MALEDIILIVMLVIFEAILWIIPKTRTPNGNILIAFKTFPIGAITCIFSSWLIRGMINYFSELHMENIQIPRWAAYGAPLFSAIAAIIWSGIFIKRRWGTEKKYNPLPSLGCFAVMIIPLGILSFLLSLLTLGSRVNCSDWRTEWHNIGTEEKIAFENQSISPFLAEYNYRLRFVRNGKSYRQWLFVNTGGRQKDVIIDQNKLYQKLAEISQDRIDNDDTANSLVGGDNSTQDMYFHYNSDEQQWYIEFGSSSFESGDGISPDTYYFASGETLADFGIYINESALNLPTDDSIEEIFDIEYYAPNYCDGFSTNSNEFTINYMKFMYTMCDSDWGFGTIISDLSSWSYQVGENYYDIPIIPPTYEYNDEEWDYIRVRFEYDTDFAENWSLYIDDTLLSYEWTTADLLSTFGIDITGSASDVEYIEMDFRPARQCNWQQFNPIDASAFATKQEFNNLSSSVSQIEEYKVFKRIQNNRDLNTMTTTGQYRIEAVGCTNLPTNAANSRFMWLFVSNYASSTQIRQVLITDYASMSSGGSGYSRYAPNIFVRCNTSNTWSSWKPLLTDECSPWISGFDKDKKQFLIHDTSNNIMKWEEGGGGSTPTYDSTNERITGS